MANILGTLSEVGRIKQIVLRRPEQAFVSQEKVDAQWRDLAYTERPSYSKAVSEYNYFVSLIRDRDSDIHFLPAADELTLDSLYVRDALILCPGGVILCNMGKSQRRYEPIVAGSFLELMDIPVLGSITGNGCIEGGDVVWLDGNTVAVGRTYRTNDEGINQFKSFLNDVDVISVPLPHYKGPSDVFHLMSILSPIDYDLAVVYSPLMPIPFREFLIERGIQLIDVPDHEFETMGCNILAVAPRKCIMLKGNPKTNHLLQQAGVQVSEYLGQEISIKGQGGPTCLTRPLVREPP
ncbi:MAG: arginine deiminase family protein [Candidatus Methanofastidiosia archaeon]